MSFVTFDALALDAAGQPVPVRHSDGGFALLAAGTGGRRPAKAACTQPYSQGGDDEANAAQLWSTAFLALPDETAPVSNTVDAC